VGHTRTLLLGTACLLVLATAGTGGFTAAEFDRTHPVAVTGDGAHLSVTAYDDAVCGPSTALTVHNRFSEVDLTDVDVTVRDTSDDVRVDAVESPASIQTGGSGDVRVWLAPDGPADRDRNWISLAVRATGGDTAAGFVRRVPVSCQPRGIEFVTLCGGSGATAASVSVADTGDATAAPTEFGWDGDGVSTVLYGTDRTVYQLDDTAHSTIREGDGHPLDGTRHTCADVAPGTMSVGTFEYNHTAGTFEEENR